MKPTKTQIEKASNEQLAEWSAIYLKEWKLENGEWFDEEGRWVETSDRFLSKWIPAENIEQAFELVENMPKRFVYFELTKFENQWYVTLTEKGLGEVEIIKVEEQETASRAITIAALLAVVEEK